MTVQNMAASLGYALLPEGHNVTVISYHQNNLIGGAMHLLTKLSFLTLAVIGVACTQIFAQPHLEPTSAALDSALTYSASVTPTDISFGSVNIGSESPEIPFTITNTGTGTLHPTLSLGLIDPCYITTECPKTLDPGASCKVGVKFRPTQFGETSLNNYITVRFDEIAAMNHVNLHGVGK